MRRISSVRILVCLVVLIIGFSIMYSPVKAGQGMNTPILSDFDVFDADIRDVMRSLAELGDINILMDPVVKGPVTIRLKHGMTVKEAIELVSQTNGYSYRWIINSRTAIIGNEKSFANFEITQTKIYQLNYAQSDQVAKALEVMVPKEKLGMDQRTNQVTVKASLLELQNIDEVIARLDRQMPQINIEARVEEVSKSAGKQLGLTYDYKADQFTNFDIHYNLLTTVQLYAMEEQHLARMIANPNISTTDSQQGKIFIGKRYPVITTETEGNKTTTTVNYIDFGTSLTVTPRINEDGIVTVTINAFVSNDDSWKDTPNGPVPVIVSREASSVVRLKDGETFVLSGLNMKKSTFNERDVPGLSKIPLIGRLFKNKQDTPFDESELCIFITPKIIGGSYNSKSTIIGQAITDDKSKNVPSSTAQTNIEVKPVATETKPQENINNVTPAIPVDNMAAKPENSVVVEPVKEQPKDVKIEEPKNVVDGSTNKLPDTVTQSPITSEAELTETKPSDSLPVLAQETKSGTLEIAPIPSAIPSSGLKVTTNVQSGESLANIAGKYGVTVESIAAENKLSIKATLKVNQKLIIPIPKEHLYQVKPKETLWRIAKRYGISIDGLKKLNNLKDDNIGSGSIIILPTSVDNVADKTI